MERPGKKTKAPKVKTTVEDLGTDRIQGVEAHGRLFVVCTTLTQGSEDPAVALEAAHGRHAGQGNKDEDRCGDETTSGEHKGVRKKRRRRLFPMN